MLPLHQTWYSITMLTYCLDFGKSPKDDITRLLKLLVPRMSTKPWIVCSAYVLRILFSVCLQNLEFNFFFLSYKLDPSAWMARIGIDLIRNVFPHLVKLWKYGPQSSLFAIQSPSHHFFWFVQLRMWQWTLLSWDCSLSDYIGLL